MINFENIENLIATKLAIQISQKLDTKHIEHLIAESITCQMLEAGLPNVDESLIVDEIQRFNTTYSLKV